MISPTYLAVQEAELEERAKKSRGDLVELQRVAAEMTRLYQAYYGRLA